LAELETQRDALAGTLTAQRTELAALLRATYTVGGAAPLKLLLAQDDVAGANRSLAYHGYLQRGRSARIAELTQELARLDAMAREIATEREALAAGRERQRGQVPALEAEPGQAGHAAAARAARYE